MKIKEIFFDVHDFLHTERVREITIVRNGELIKISEAQVGDTDLLSSVENLTRLTRNFHSNLSHLGSIYQFKKSSEDLGAISIS